MLTIPYRVKFESFSGLPHDQNNFNRRSLKSPSNPCRLFFHQNRSAGLVSYITTHHCTNAIESRSPIQVLSSCSQSTNVSEDSNALSNLLIDHCFFWRPEKVRRESRSAFNDCHFTTRIMPTDRSLCIDCDTDDEVLD